MTIAADERHSVRVGRLAQPGRNCARIVHADRLGLVVDGDEYFRALRHALLNARRSILMLGWEFDSRTRMRRDADCGPEDEIGHLLDAVVRSRPELEAHVLIWDSALIYAVTREFGGIIKMGWLTHHRLHFRLDDSHPIGASHHQKIVVVDESLAFVGGLDVSSERWDTRAHEPLDRRRSDAAVASYPPFHDLMAILTGEAAGALADIFRERWRCACGQRLAASLPCDPAPLWPEWVAERLADVRVAIALTSPPWDGGGSVRQVETLYLDMIASARRFIYIENQYFASRRIAQAIEERLCRPDCPEIVVVNPGQPISLVERSTMGVARARLYARLRLADPGGKLRLYYPTVDGADVKVHAKLMIVDDRLLRVGSSNLNNRSMGLDTECDILVEAMGDRSVEQGIADIRRDLMAEHLGVSAAAIVDAEAAAGSLHGAIRMLSGERHTLVELDDAVPDDVIELIADSPMPDPEEPIETLVMVEEAMPTPTRRPTRMRMWSLASLLAFLALVGGLWRWAPFEVWSVIAPWVDWVAGLRTLPETAALATLMFLVGGLVRIPLVLLVLAASAALGPWLGAFQALLGALGSAALLYLVGRWMGRARVRRLAGWKINRVHRALARHGIMAMVVLRLMPVAAFSVINLVAGASGVRFRDFILGSAIGMAPGFFAISVVGDQLVTVLRNPTTVNIVVLAAASAVVIALIFGLVERLGRARAPQGRRS